MTRFTCRGTSLSVSLIAAALANNAKDETMDHVMLIDSLSSYAAGTVDAILDLSKSSPVWSAIGEALKNWKSNLFSIQNVQEWNPPLNADSWPSRGWSLPVAPRALPLSSALLQLLIDTQMGSYLDCLAVDAILFYPDSSSTALAVPCAKEAVFNANEWSLADKRRLMRLVEYMLKYEEMEKDPLLSLHGMSQESMKSLSWSSFLNQFPMPMADLVWYGMMERNEPWQSLETSTWEIMGQTAFFVQGLKHSLRPYGKAPFLWMQHGAFNEIIQALARFAAVRGAVCWLNAPETNDEIENENRTDLKEENRNERNIEATDLENSIQIYSCKSATAEYSIRAIAIKTVSDERESAVEHLVYQLPSFSPIRVWLCSSATGHCPRGFELAFISLPGKDVSIMKNFISLHFSSSHAWIYECAQYNESVVVKTNNDERSFTASSFDVDASLDLGRSVYEHLTKNHHFMT